MRHALDKALGDRIGAADEHDRDGARGTLHRPHGVAAVGKDQVGRPLQQPLGG
jgi:hypothetical protein